MITTRACAYVTLKDRKTACKILDKYRNVEVRKKQIKVSSKNPTNCLA